MTKPLHERLRLSLERAYIAGHYDDTFSGHKELCAEVAALETAARALVDALPRCLIHSSTFAERAGWIADDGSVVYHCSDCQREGPTVPWDEQLRALLEVLK